MERRAIKTKLYSHGRRDSVPRRPEERKQSREGC